MLLEWPDEQIKRKEIESLLRDFTLHIRRLNHTSLTEQEFRRVIHELLLAQDDNLIDRYGNQQSYVNWSFINSFFFAITVITTVGYGHLTPRTIMGKIFCIIYALFGIPITSLLIGSVADRFSKLYSPKKLPRGLKRTPTYQRQLSTRFLMLRRGLISLVPWFFAFLVVPAWIFRYLEGWSFLDGFYYCFVTLSTIGFGDYVAGSFEKNYIWIYKIIIVFWIIFGLAYLSMILNFITNALRSRRISNVMNSLRVKINSNGNLATRIQQRRQQDDHHCHHYEPQQSTMLTIFNDQQFINNNFFINHNNNQ
ncbi:Acid-sensitive two pore domain K+ channel dTASK-6-like protein, partial [Euroglyphus maynei]